MTFEEFSTLAAQIEACLNSRPLSPLSADPEDVAALTPGHFLIGSPLTAVPEPSAADLSILGNQRYRITTQMREHFWRRWQRKTLQTLQKRAKWPETRQQLREEDLVLLTDTPSPPTRWPSLAFSSATQDPMALRE